MFGGWIAASSEPRNPNVAPDPNVKFWIGKFTSLPLWGVFKDGVMGWIPIPDEWIEQVVDGEYHITPVIS
jgi:hypothetical protein